MGHERIGILPKSKRWASIVDQIALFSHDNNNVAAIAKKTIRNVRKRLEDIERDGGVQAAFKFLVILTIASKTENPKDTLRIHGITLPENISPIQIAKAVKSWVSENIESKEYATIAKSAAIDAISEWYRIHNVQTKNIFTGEFDPFDVWRKAASGRGFCELSRFYFSKFTERYLKYFLEREASASISNINDRNHFNKKIEGHIDDISKHAFEIAKITQSFAAGWFNKYVKDKVPTNLIIRRFLSLTFGKMRAELLREEKG